MKDYKLYILAIVLAFVIAFAAFQFFSARAEKITIVGNTTFQSVYSDPIEKIKSSIIASPRFFIVEDFTTNDTGVVALCGAELARSAALLGKKPEEIKPYAIGSKCTDPNQVERPVADCLNEINGYAVAIRQSDENKVYVSDNGFIISGNTTFLQSCQTAFLLHPARQATATPGLGNLTNSS